MTRTPARTPVWKSIADTLRAEIARGDTPPGAKLPTEASLATRFGVNRHTIRHALKSLAEEGLTHSRRGSGVFVTAKPTPYPIGRRVRFHQNLAAAGRTGIKRLLNLTTRKATAAEAEALALPRTALVHAVEGLSLADTLPVALFTSIFPAKPFPNLLEALTRTQSVTAALADAGIADYTRASTKLSAERATALQALHLQLPEGAPLIHATALNIAPDATPIEYGDTWFAGDRIQLEITPT